MLAPAEEGETKVKENGLEGDYLKDGKLKSAYLLFPCFSS